MSAHNKRQVEGLWHIYGLCVLVITSSWLIAKFDISFCGVFSSKQNNVQLTTPLGHRPLKCRLDDGTDVEFWCRVYSCFSLWLSSLKTHKPKLLNSLQLQRWTSLMGKKTPYVNNKQQFYRLYYIHEPCVLQCNIPPCVLLHRIKTEAVLLIFLVQKITRRTDRTDSGTELTTSVLSVPGRCYRGWAVRATSTENWDRKCGRKCSRPPASVFTPAFGAVHLCADKMPELLNMCTSFISTTVCVCVNCSLFYVHFSFIAWMLNLADL